MLALIGSDARTARRLRCPPATVGPSARGAPPFMHHWQGASSASEGGVPTLLRAFFGVSLSGGDLRGGWGTSAEERRRVAWRELAAAAAWPTGAEELGLAQSCCGF